MDGPPDDWAMTPLPSDPDRLVLTGEFPQFSPQRLFEYWTHPVLLTLWWPPEADVEPQVGGAYHLAWPRQDWHLRGHYTVFGPGQALAFTWAWDHEPDTPQRTVTLAFVPMLGGGGTRLTITHGPYTDSARDQQDRQSHLEGWQAFCSQLWSQRPIDLHLPPGKDLS